jgi:hypothetical protein
MTKQKPQREEENLEEMKYNLIKSRFRTAALVLLGAFALFILVVLSLTC